MSGTITRRAAVAGALTVTASAALPALAAVTVSAAHECRRLILPAVMGFGVLHDLDMDVSVDETTRAVLIGGKTRSNPRRALGFCFTASTIADGLPSRICRECLEGLGRSLSLPQAEYDHRFGQDGYEAVAA